MKQIFKSHRATTLFFNDNVSTQSIATWINSELITGCDLFGLNEAHSCRAKTINDDEIIISGDEDCLDLQIELVTVII